VESALARRRLKMAQELPARAFESGWALLLRKVLQVGKRPQQSEPDSQPGLSWTRFSASSPENWIQRGSYSASRNRSRIRALKQGAGECPGAFAQLPAAGTLRWSFITVGRYFPAAGFNSARAHMTPPDPSRLFYPH
jgi:hypothetical protein